MKYQYAPIGAPADVIRGFMNILEGDKRVILSLN